jgi:glycosyltransferase involved in cell wall biosynthesis
MLTSHSAECLPVGRILKSDPNIRLKYFGISTDTFPLTAPVKNDFTSRKIRLLAIGNDRTRDWDTYLRAFGNEDAFDITLVCHWAPKSYERQYKNLTIKHSIPPYEFRQIYDDCDFVVLPMSKNRYSGITVTLEAVALGKPVICSYTGGCPTYFDHDEVTFVPAGDADALRRAALHTDATTAYARACRAQERFRRDDYSTKGMMDRYVELSRQVLHLS